MKSFFTHRRGFTLIEIMVVVSIIGILSAISVYYLSKSGEISRNAKRQADIQLLKEAVEQYKFKNGRYPQGCNGPNNWSGEVGTANQCPGAVHAYISGLAPEFLRVLPKDPRISPCLSSNTECGYRYTVNSAGTVYKIMAVNTVEGEVVTMEHKYKSCEIKQKENFDIMGAGWCASKPDGSNAINPGDPAMYGLCHPDTARFQKSYAVWGGFAPLRADACVSGTVCIDTKPADLTLDPLNSFINGPTETQKYQIRARAIQDTTTIICK